MNDASIAITPAATSYHDTQDDINNIIQYLIALATNLKASDIHLEPYQEYYRLRLRIDGLLQDHTQLAIDIAKRLVSRLKMIGNLNIAEKRLPQDGQFTLQNHTQLTIRINTCPTIHGEKIVLRIANNALSTLSLHHLGLQKSQQDLLQANLINPQGLILVTGPTGSGKTATLYSALNAINSPEKNIITIEDPVERNLNNITQIQINNSIGLNFSSILRSILRQDPDVIMIGEIRDHDTATLATHAASTGHLVLTTLHTNHAFEAVARLQSLGLTIELSAHCISLIIAQRLVRKLCPHCKQLQAISNYHPLTHLTQMTHEFRAVGCEHCQQGYLGRIGIFECLPINDPIIPMLKAYASYSDIELYMHNQGWPTLSEACLAQIINGVTNFDEYLRVVGGCYDVV